MWLVLGRPIISANILPGEVLSGGGVEDAEEEPDLVVERLTLAVIFGRVRRGMGTLA